MPISLVCSCGKRLRVPDESKGKKVRCPGCKALLTAEEPKAAVKKAAAAAARPAKEPASKAETEKAPATAKPKKSSARVFLLLGCGCLGLVMAGGAVVVAIIIAAVAAHKGPEARLLGRWILDKDATRQNNPAVLRAHKDIRYEFRKDGTCTVRLNNETTERTWQFLKENAGELVINLSVPGETTPTAVFIKFMDDDHCEMSYPLYCRMRRAAPGEEDGGPASPGGGGPGGAGPRLLSGHKKMVTALAFSADGKRLASSSLDETARVWDVDSGAVKQTLTGQPGDVRGVAFSPDGKTLFTAGGSFRQNVGTVKSWDADGGQMKLALHTQKNAVTTLALSPDGKFLAWDDGTWAVLWDVGGGAARTTFKDLGGGVRDLAFSRDGKKLALCDSSGGVRVWDVERPGAPPVTTRVKEALSLAWAPDGTLAVGSEAQKVTLWVPATKTVRRVLVGFPGDVRGVAFSPDGKVLAASSRDTIKCFDPADFRELGGAKSTSPRDAQVGRLAFSPDGKTLGSGSAEADSGGILLWDVGALLKGKS